MTIALFVNVGEMGGWMEGMFFICKAQPLDKSPPVFYHALNTRGESGGDLTSESEVLSTGSGSHDNNRKKTICGGRSSWRVKKNVIRSEISDIQLVLFKFGMFLVWGLRSSPGLYSLVCSLSLRLLFLEWLMT